MAPKNLTIEPLTDEMRNLEEARQNEVDAGTGVEDALDNVASSFDQTRRQPTEREGDDADQGREARTVIARSPQDAARLAIASRFKRGEQDIPFDGDFTNPENLYGIAGRRPAEEPDPAGSIVGDAIADENLTDEEYDAQVAARELNPQPQRKPKPTTLNEDVGHEDDGEPEPQRQAQPQMITRKVRGKDVTKSLDDWLIDASKVTAADQYLEESRKLLEDAREMRSQAERAGRDPQHPEGRTHTQDDGDDIDPTTGQPRQPEDEFEQLAEQLQYGDPKENGKRLKGVMEKVATKATSEDHINRLFNNDLARSQKALKDFEAANPDLAADEISRLAIERTMYGLYREDMLKLGLQETQIPSNPKELANWHRFYKIHGHEVRNTPEMLVTAKEKFLAWRGGSPTPKPAVPRREREAPRVEVNVDRTRRRESIPNQPTRASVPRRDVAPAPTRTPGSDIVAGMRKARGQI